MLGPIPKIISTKNHGIYSQNDFCLSDQLTHPGTGLAAKNNYLRIIYGGDAQKYYSG